MKEQKPTLLMYGFEDIFSINVITSAITSSNLNLQIKQISRKDYNRPIGFFAGSIADNRTEANYAEISAAHILPEFSDKMIILCNIESSMFDKVLLSLKQAGFGADIFKAVLTPVNQYWLPSNLLAELKKEKAAIEQIQK